MRAFRYLLPTIFIIVFNLSGVAIAKYIAAAPVDSSKYYITACDTILIHDLIQVLVENSNEWIFSDHALFYCSPDISSPVIDSIPFYTRIRVREQFIITDIDTLPPMKMSPPDKRVRTKRSQERWNKVYYNDRWGYIQQKEQAMRSLGSNLLIGGDEKGRFLLKSMDPERLNIVADLDTLPYMHCHDFSFLYFNGLAFTDRVLVYRTYRQSCPGAQILEFIAIGEAGELSKIISSYMEGEAGEYTYESIYFPMKFGNGSILLVQDGNVEEIFNTQTTELNIFDYPENIGVPIEQLVVKTKEYTEPILDEEGGYIYDEDQFMKVKVIKEAPRYFKWDGKTLTEL